MSWVISAVAGALAATVTGVVIEVRRARKLRRASVQGDLLEFDGSVEGPTPYCHPRGGRLRIEADRMTWLNAPAGIAYPVPLDALVHLGSRVEGAWGIAECADGDERVEIRCPAYALRYVEEALRR